MGVRENDGYESIVDFCAWLTTREEVLTISSNHNVGDVVSIIDEFCKNKGPRQSIAEKNIIARMIEMGTESLNPDSFIELSRICGELKSVRKNLKS